MSQTQTPAVTAAMDQMEAALKELCEEHEQCLGLLLGFCERFHWVKDHDDFQEKVREFLTNIGLQPRPYDH